MKDKNIILITDDAEINREIIKDIFDGQYIIMEAHDGEEAIEIIQSYSERLCMIFLDLIMPKKSGLDVLKFMNDEGYIKYIPVIMITGESTDETDEKAYEYGASDIIYKPFAEKVVMRRTKNIIELFENRLHLEYKLEKRTKQLMESRKKREASNEFLINALSSVVEFRNLESGEHIQRVKKITEKFMKYVMQEFPEYNITKEKSELMVSASSLHDIGKIAISDNILLKPGRLSAEEYEEMKKHTIYGCELLEMFKQEESEFYRYCYDICRYHHERYDGNGYPDKLKGEDIPIWAQVVSIADVYDALTSKRVYKPAYDDERAIKMILNGECGVFSPKLIHCLNLAKKDLLDMR